MTGFTYPNSFFRIEILVAFNNLKTRRLEGQKNKYYMYSKTDMSCHCNQSITLLSYIWVSMANNEEIICIKSYFYTPN